MVMEGGVGAPLQFRRCVIAGGEGAVRRLFRSLLAGVPGRELVIVDPRAPAVDCGRDHTLACDLREPERALQALLGSADLVLLATPETVALQMVPVLAQYLPRHCLLVDTLSVKSRMADRVDASGLSCQAQGFNPMFAPSLGFRGQSAVATPYRPGPLASVFNAMVEGAGCRVREMRAGQHDRTSALLQVATHAAILSFGQVLRRSGYDLAASEAVMPPPHRTLLALLARILSADPEVYWDIQVANPGGGALRDELSECVESLRSMVDANDESSFRRALESVREIFGDSDHRYQALCADLFRQLTRSMSSWNGIDGRDDR